MKHLCWPASTVEFACTVENRSMVHRSMVPSNPVLLKLWAAARYLAVEACLPGRGLTPATFISYRAFRKIRKYSTVSILTLS